MFRYPFLMACILLVCFKANAQQKKALLIGINKYSAPQNTKASTSFLKRSIVDLDGPENDIAAVGNIISSKFGFKEQDISSLLNEQATRENIILSIKNLLNKCNKGDIAFLFYAGHGSQVNNSLSAEQDKKDETIVPVDAWKEGVKDIRDKELAVLFNLFLEKGVKLTVIFDCCHSGSLQRGPGMLSSKSRFAGEDADDVKDPFQPPSPGANPNNDFLFFSGSQDNETASEQLNDFGQSQGAFTIALIGAINQLSVQSSAEILFTSLNAILKSNGKSQEPVMALSAGRKGQTLFGISRAELYDKTIVAVSGYDAKTKSILLQGGFALGIYPRTELIKVDGKDTTLLKVDTVLGLNKSVAKVLKGNELSIRPGQFFEVANWVSSDAPLLKIYIPTTGFLYSDILKLNSIDKTLRQSSRISAITRLDRSTADYNIFFSNDKFYINNAMGANEIITPSADELKRKIKPGSSYYFEIPPDKLLVEKIIQSFKRNPMIALVKSADEANYVLYGMTDDEGKPAYGLRNPIINVNDSLGSLPLQTQAYSLMENSPATYQALAENLYATALKLGKLNGWLKLTPPIAAVKNFPFSFSLMDLRKNEVKKNNTCHLNDSIGFHIILNNNYSITEKKIPTSYLYVFAVDRSGKMQLVFPMDGNGSNNENSRFPFFNASNELIRDKELFSYNVVEPVGTDNFFLLVTDNPINNCESIFNQEGVNGIGIKDGDTNPLLKIINLGNEGYRARDGVTPENWTLMKLAVKTMH